MYTYLSINYVYYLRDALAARPSSEVAANARHRPRASGTGCPVEFVDNLSRFGGVSEAEAEREPTGEILSEPKDLEPVCGVSEASAEREPAEPALRC